MSEHRKAFKKMKQIAEGEDCIERTMLANALLIDKIKRKPLPFDKCTAILELIADEKD